MSDEPGPVFETEVTFPDNAFDAARIFLAVMAYPERGAGQPGGLGVPFTKALWEYLVWTGRQAKGLRYTRGRFGDPAFRPPARRDFEGTLNRGLRRLRRRSTTYSLIGTQMINGFFAVMTESARLAHEGRSDEAFITPPRGTSRGVRPDLWIRHTRSPLQTINHDVERWATRFGLNTTGRSADRERKAKDLVRRAYLQSRPVLHMAHAIEQVCDEIGPTLNGWDDWDWLLVLLWNPESWVWNAIDIATTWRALSHFHYTPELEPAHMIMLIRPEKNAE